jgi:uncharacterized hydrophobic protein (TIGR00271 family)
MSLMRNHAALRLLRVGRSAMAPLSGQPDDVVLQAVWEVSRPSRVYWLMNALATIIACYGLLADSAAVVIGAMVVAMLLGPISGIALGLNKGDGPLLWTALFSLSGGILWILAIGVVVGFIHHDVPLTGEILARTDPRLFDLMIALAGGAAGAVAVVSPRVSTAIVGVAVATALVPPLAAAGILLARAEFALAGGALLLVLTNVAAIEVAFSTIFWISGYRRLTEVGAEGLLVFLRRNVFGLALVGGLAVMLGVQLDRAISRSLFESKVEAVLRQHLNPAAGFHVVDLRLADQGETTIVRAVVRGPEMPSARDVADAQSDLPAAPNGAKPQLRLRFIQVVIMTPQGPLVGDDDDLEGDH